MTNERQNKTLSRRRVVGTSVAALAGTIAAPSIANAQAGRTTTWKVQTSWPAGCRS